MTNISEGTFLHMQAAFEQARDEYPFATKEVAIDFADCGVVLRIVGIRAAEESVTFARITLDTEQRKLGVGTSTLFQVQTRNQEFLEARSRLLRNQLDYRISQARLRHVQGILLGPDGD